MLFRSNNIIYNDGTVLLYSECKNTDGETTEFRAALRRPGDEEWTVIHRTLKSLYQSKKLCFAYHAGKIVVTRCIGSYVVTTTNTSDDVLLCTPSSSTPLKSGGYLLQEHPSTRVLRRAFILAFVHRRSDYYKKYEKGAPHMPRFLMVSVHVLEETPEPRWVRKEGTSLANLVLFLGWPNSFCVDASRLGINIWRVGLLHAH